MTRDDDFVITIPAIMATLVALLVVGFPAALAVYLWRRK